MLYSTFNYLFLGQQQSEQKNVFPAESSICSKEWFHFWREILLMNPLTWYGRSLTHVFSMGWG